MRTGALGIDAEQLAAAQDLQAGRDRARRCRAARPVDRHLAGAGEERLLQPALDAGVVKYSALATNVTRRGITSGMNSQSEYERWLLARIAAPSSGTFSVPSAYGRKISLSNGPNEDPLEQPVEHPHLLSLL